MLRFFQRSLLFYVWLVSIVPMACSAQSEVVTAANPCTINLELFKKLPQLVLIGTDVVQISSFKLRSEQLHNSYTAEIGGASLSIDTSQVAKGQTIIRTYHEPGIPKQSKTYQPVCAKQGLLSARDLKGKVVEGGLLLLEEKPDQDGIPNNLWIFYKIHE